MSRSVFFMLTFWYTVKKYQTEPEITNGTLDIYIYSKTRELNLMDIKPIYPTILSTLFRILDSQMWEKNTVELK